MPRCVAVLAGLVLVTQQLAAQQYVLPTPSSVTATREAPFVLRDPVVIALADSTQALLDAATLLSDAIGQRTGFRVRVLRRPATTEASPAEAAGSTGRIVLAAESRAERDEGYTLTVAAGEIRITGRSAAGTRWGVQTLRQLLPPEFEDANGPRRAAWEIPAVRITDAPRFAWRGTMLDAGRHFLPVAAVKRHLDLMARYKLNVLHWHLTEDQGWRIAIERYPELTRVGAWRTEEDGRVTGGFYTQAEVREVVEYARVRGIMVVPEIEMPGHSVAAIASYPWLGCTGDSLRVATQWGVFADVYCPGKPSTFTFLEGVLDEVIALFPSPYVHIGGDEVPKDRWRSCDSCQALMRREGLADEDELQRWFVNRIARYLEAKGRRLIGWNEIMHGGALLPSAMVQSWEDSSWTRRAAVAGHDVIASPSEWTYLNRSPGDLTLAQVYAFEPVPPGLTEAQRARVLGSEVTFWSEHITSPTNLELMAWPRQLAFAEIMWSAAPRDLEALRARLRTDHVPRLRALGVAVGPENAALVNTSVSYDTSARTARLRIASSVSGLTVRMTRDGSLPTAASPVVVDSQRIDGDGFHRWQAFLGADPVLEDGRLVLERHRAVGSRVRATPAPAERYRGTGDANLTDGLRGSLLHGDGLWQGWWGPDVEFTVDLDSLQSIASVSIDFLQNIRSWMLLPREVAFAWSADGVTWSPEVMRTHAIPADREGAIQHRFAVEVPGGTRARHLRIRARNGGLLPAGHPGAGQASWLFADEIVVR